MAWKSNIKLVIADMEGTLFYPVVKMTHGIAPSSWTLMAQKLGKEALEREEQMKSNWISGGYKNIKGNQSYLHFMKDTVSMHKMYGLTKEIFEQGIDVPYHPEVKETYEYFNEKGYLTALVSGGFTEQAERAQKDLKLDFILAGCKYFWNSDNKIDHYALQNSDYDGKVNFIKGIIKEEGIDPNQCAFIGDGPNDVGIAREVGLSIAFNGVPELEEASLYSIKQKPNKEDFREIVKFFDETDYRTLMKTKLEPMKK